MRARQYRHPLAQRFALCITPGDRKTLMVLLAQGHQGDLAVRRAAVRTAAEPAHAMRVCEQWYRTGRREAPVALVICHAPGVDPLPLVDGLRRAVGPLADISVVQGDGRVRAGTWGTAVRGAAAGLEVTFSRKDTRAVMELVRRAEWYAIGTEAG